MDIQQIIADKLSVSDYQSWQYIMEGEMEGVTYRGEGIPTYRWCSTLYDLLRYVKIYGEVTDPVYMSSMLWCVRHDENSFKATDTWTDEQLAIITSEVPVTLVQAFAGSGKTSTLFEYARRRNGKKILYLAFNKELEQSAKRRAEFDGIDMEIHTIHALALDTLKGMKILQDNVRVGRTKEKDLVKLGYDKRAARDIMHELQTYCSGDTDDIYIGQTYNKPYAKYVVKNTRRVWDLMFAGKLRMNHDVYLKKFQLMKNDLGYDITMVDEIQDCTKCQMNIVHTQSGKKVLVGDIHQQIYHFRGVCNPFTSSALTLSRTFRFGFEIADIANNFLRIYKGENKCMKSPLHIRSIITTKIPENERYTIICRSNQGMLETGMGLVGKKIYFMGRIPKFEKEIQIIKDIINIEHGNTELVENEKVKRVANFGDGFLERLIDENIDNKRWALRVVMYTKYGERLVEMYQGLMDNRVNDVDDADVILTNAHQAKGLEFDIVVMGSDFSDICYVVNGSIRHRVKHTLHELYNLLYVTMTRAKKKLVINKQMMHFIRTLNMWGHAPIVKKELSRCKECNEYVMCNMRRISEEDTNYIGYEEPVLHTVYGVCTTCVGF